MPRWCACILNYYMYEHFWYIHVWMFLSACENVHDHFCISAHSVYIQGMMFQHEVSILILWGWWWWVSVLSAFCPQHFTHDVSAFRATIYHSGLVLFQHSSLLTLEFHIFALSTCNQGQFLPIKISGDMHVTTSCCLTVCISNPIAYILQMAWSNALTCIYSGTKLLNSYSPFERPLSWQIMSASHQNVTWTLSYKNFSIE